MRESSLALDGARVGFKPVVFDIANWNPHWLVEKWSEEACQFARRRLGLDHSVGIGSELLRKLVGKPEDEAETIGNLMLNAGIQRMEDVLLGVVTTNLYTNGNSRLGVGDSSTAEAASQTDLQAATNKLFKAMNATFPSRAAQTITFVSDFTSAEANYVWNEFVTDNGATNRAVLNRKVASLGTKTTGTWTLTETIAIT